MTAPAAERVAPMLNQIVAVRTTVKSDTADQLTANYSLLKKANLVNGLSRKYKSHAEGGFEYPNEMTMPQVKAVEVLHQIAKDMTKYFDVTAALDWTNQQARADINIWAGDKPMTLLRQVPVTYLMFLEKQLVNMEEVLKKLPTLDPAETWTFDATANLYRSAPVGTVKTKKLWNNHVKAPATDKHPAQVETYTTDEPIGTWETTKLSGAVPVSYVNKLLGRVRTLTEAVKFAREQANMTEVVDQKPGRVIFEYLFPANVEA